jgi:anti-sigma factor RsiW
MMMTCGRARRLLWPDTGPREATAEIVAAREHASRCPLCRRFLDDMRRLSDRIREAVPRPEAPVEVRDRLFKALARARTDEASRGPVRRHRAWAAALAVALLVAGTWLGLSLVPERVNPSADPLGAIAEDHLRSQRTTGLASSDSLEVTRWLADRLPFALEIPIFPGAQLKGARLLLVNRQSGAVVDYVIAGRSLSYYVLPAVAGEATSSAREIRVTSRAGYRVAAWEDGGLTHALVAGLPGPTLVELAHYCIEQMMAAGPGTSLGHTDSLVTA